MFGDMEDMDWDDMEDMDWEDMDWGDFEDEEDYRRQLKIGKPGFKAVNPIMKKQADIG